MNFSRFFVYHILYRNEQSYTDYVSKWHEVQATHDLWTHKMHSTYIEYEHTQQRDYDVVERIGTYKYPYHYYTEYQDLVKILDDVARPHHPMSNTNILSLE